jgi:ribonuclease HI
MNSVVEVQLFTDGACWPNPGPGGWACILRHPESLTEMELSGSDPDSTNNRMEMQAVISGLEALKRKTRVAVYSDSAYVIQGATNWMKSWKKTNWKRTETKKINNKKTTLKVDVKNIDLWKRISQLIELHEVIFFQVRGHSGHIENERCDQLALTASRRQSGQRESRKSYIKEAWMEPIPVIADKPIEQPKKRKKNRKKKHYNSSEPELSFRS